MNRRKPRTYTYRVPLDDRKAFLKINFLDSLNEHYWISKLSKSQIPTAGNGRHFGYVFYQSQEHFDHDLNEMVGGTIPGLHEYRYSLEWQPCPIDSGLEMRNGNSGGTKIKGELFIGTHDSRLSDYAPIDLVVPWTPTEIEAMYNGEPVPDRINYSHDPPEIDAETALDQLRMKIQSAKQDSFEKMQEALYEYEENCDHSHVLKTGREYGDVAFCEDCGRSWQRDTFSDEKDDLTVVGTA